MKKLFILFLFSSSVFANNSTQRSANDLMYLPNEGGFSVEAEFSSVSDETEVTFENRNYSSSDGSSSTLDFGITYGVNNSTSVQVAAEYEFKNEDETKYGPASTSNGETEKEKSKGISDPKLTIKNRIIEQDATSPNIDLSLFFSPKTGDSESASTTKEGNNLRGSHLFGFQADIGKKYDRFQVKASLEFEYYGDTKTKSLSDGTTTKTDSSQNWTLDLEGQLHLTNNLFTRAAIGFGFFGDQEATTSDGTKFNTSIDKVVIFNIGVGLDISDNTSFLAAFGGTKFDYDQNYPASNQTFNIERDLTALTLGVRHQF